MAPEKSTLFSDAIVYVILLPLQTVVVFGLMERLISGAGTRERLCSNDSVMVHSFTSKLIIGYEVVATLFQST